MPYTQKNRLIALATPLGEDVLLLQGFRGQEGMSRLFHFQLELLSEKPTIPFSQIVGQPVTIRLSLADGSPRYINGCVSRFAQTGSDTLFTHYRAEVVPWLWFLTRTADCRIFQNMTVPDIMLKIFKDLGFHDVKNALEGSFEPRDYCVQYRETTFHFISRLMEQYGMFYFFEHEEDKHTLVLANSAATHRPCLDQPQARYEYAAGELFDDDVITTWQMEQEVRPGKYALTGYNFETPKADLAANITSTVHVGGNGKLEIYDYLGEYLKKPQSEHLVKLRMEEEEAPHVVASGSSTCRAFIPGYSFTLEGHPCQDMDTSYVLTEVHHVASVGHIYSEVGSAVQESYTNQFSCMPRATPYRPPRTTPRPLVQGPQTAVVVGKAGEEIWTDKYGRVKVQFHWDREGKRDENSSCWMRVSHPSAGKGWGSVNIPRIGQEVIVDFLEGDPDQPIITGRVYNAETMPPYGLPAGGMVSGLKSNSTPGGGGYNEMSMNDTKGKEKITVHAQYDMDTTIQHDETHTVKTGNRTIKVETGTHTETIKGDTTIKIETGKYNHDVITGTATYHVKSDVTQTYDAKQTAHVIGDVKEDFDATQKTTVKKTIEITSAEANIVITAETQIKLQTGDSLLIMNADGSITLSGKKIEITGSDEVKMGVGNQNVICDTQKVGTSGAAINSSAVGKHEITGAVVKIN